MLTTSGASLPGGKLVDIVKDDEVARAAVPIELVRLGDDCEGYDCTDWALMRVDTPLVVGTEDTAEAVEVVGTAEEFESRPGRLAEAVAPVRSAEALLSGDVTEAEFKGLGDEADGAMIELAEDAEPGEVDNSSPGVVNELKDGCVEVESTGCALKLPVTLICIDASDADRLEAGAGLFGGFALLDKADPIEGTRGMERDSDRPLEVAVIVDSIAVEDEVEVGMLDNPETERSEAVLLEESPEEKEVELATGPPWLPLPSERRYIGVEDQLARMEVSTIPEKLDGSWTELEMMDWALRRPDTLVATEVVVVDGIADNGGDEPEVTGPPLTGELDGNMAVTKEPLEVVKVDAPETDEVVWEVSIDELVSKLPAREFAIDGENVEAGFDANVPDSASESSLEASPTEPVDTLELESNTAIESPPRAEEAEVREVRVDALPGIVDEAVEEPRSNGDGIPTP
jgi:hypothetical protein